MLIGLALASRYKKRHGGGFNLEPLMLGAILAIFGISLLAWYFAASEWELLAWSDGQQASMFEGAYQREYRTIRKEWANTIAGNLEGIERILDMYFDGLYPVVFSEDGSVQYPIPSG